VAVDARACPRFPSQNLNGKEGVDGSSPSEGFEKTLQMGLSLSAQTPLRRLAGTRRVHFRTSRHSRARATHAEALVGPIIAPDRQDDAEANAVAEIGDRPRDAFHFLEPGEDQGGEPEEGDTEDGNEDRGP
jgi:hypothetical protein